MTRGERQCVSGADEAVRSWLHPQTSHKVVEKSCRLHEENLKLRPDFTSVKGTT